jgi:hypothetical protein
LSAIELSVFMTVAPKAVDRAHRLQYALLLLRRKITEREVRLRIEEHCKVSQPTAWRTVEMAKDIL